METHALMKMDDTHDDQGARNPDSVCGDETKPGGANSAPGRNMCQTCACDFQYISKSINEVLCVQDIEIHMLSVLGMVQSVGQESSTGSGSGSRHCNCVLTSHTSFKHMLSAHDP